MGKKEISKHFYIPRAACERTITGWAVDWHTIFHQPHVASFDFISMNNEPSKEHENINERKKFLTFTCERTRTDATEATEAHSLIAFLWVAWKFIYVLNELSKWTPTMSDFQREIASVESRHNSDQLKCEHTLSNWCAIRIWSCVARRH